MEKTRRDEAQKLKKRMWLEEYQRELKTEKEKQLEQLQKEQMKRAKALERQFEEERRKVEELTEEPEMEEEDWEDYDEDAWSRWHQEEEYVEHAPDSSSKESSFVVVSTGKESPSKEETENEPDIMEALKMVMEHGRKTVEMVLNAQKEKTTSEEEKLDQEVQQIKIVESEKLEEPTEESAAIICGDWMH